MEGNRFEYLVSRVEETNQLTPLYARSLVIDVEVE